MPEPDEKQLLELLALIDEWLGNSEPLMIDDIVEWREKLAAALGKEPRG